ncbi:MAG: hypothetical protein ABIN04_14590 [Ginsengibacter sp.]
MSEPVFLQGGQHCRNVIKKESFQGWSTSPEQVVTMDQNPWSRWIGIYILNNERIIIEPKEGTFTFIYDYANFIPFNDITIIGIENPENLRHIQKQQKLFKNFRPLFVSRYPQNKDLIRWLVSIDNNYLHFGDFDFAGLNIYWNEYKKHLRERASFFLPGNIEELLLKNGNRDN